MSRHTPPSEGVHYDAGFSHLQYMYDAELGFYRLPEHDDTLNRLRLLGFGAPLSRGGGFDTRTEVEPLVEFNQLHPEHRTIDLNGKGVGPRMYNTPAAAQGFPTLPDMFGAYTFAIDRSTLHDTRSSEGGALRRIGRHGLRIVKSMGGNVAEVVAGVHEGYADASAVLYTQPPAARLRQFMRHEGSPDEVPPEFIIIRNAAIRLKRVGTVRSLTA